jgi:signal transduction histidine kinase
VITMADGARRLRELGRSWLDRLLVGCWLVVLESEALTSNHRHGPLALNAAVVAAMALAGLWRRRSPLVFLAVTGLLAISLSQGLTSRDYGTLVGVYSVLAPTYAVGAWERTRPAVAGIMIWAAAAALAGGLIERASLGGLVGPLLAAGAAWSAGMAVRAQRELAARLRDTTTRLAAERGERARLAVADERARIARDLHMLVARSVAAMVVKAEVARELLDVRPADALAPMTAIEEAGREALAEMRRILGVLRRPDEVGDWRLQAGLGKQEVLA